MRALFLFTILTSTVANAGTLSWSEIAAGQAVTLRQKFTLGPNGPTFNADLDFAVLTAEPLSIPASMIRLREEPCVEPSRTSPMELVTPEGNQESSAVGLQLSGDCVWKVFVETKDLETPSLFSAKSVSVSLDSQIAPNP